MADGEHDDVIEDVLELDDAIEDTGDEGDDALDDSEALIGFADEDGDGEEETPLIKKLRQQVRELSKRAAAPRAEPSDPEPVVPPRKTLEDFDFDQERLDAYEEGRDKARDAHADWKVRQAKREAAEQERGEAQARQIEQQRRALGVNDYEERSAKVKDALSEQQLAILVSAADNPAQLIYALGKSEAKLDVLSGEENLAKFAAMVGKYERDIKVTRRSAPAPESRVRGATATTEIGGSDRELARLEKEAERTGNRTKLIAYKRRLKAA